MEERRLPGGNVEHAADQLEAAFVQPRLSFRRLEYLAHRPAHVGFDGTGELRRWRGVGIDLGQPRDDVVDQVLDVRALSYTMQLGIEGARTAPQSSCRGTKSGVCR